MAVDKNKVAAEASKFIQRGQFDKAIRAYQKVLAADPGDVRVLLKIGELQQKKGDDGAAAETFGRVADAYGQQGFFLKAVAVYKQMAKLAPDDVRVNERLAGLYQQLGLLSEAMAQLQIIAGGAERAGDDDRLVEVLRRMVELDPDNVGSSVKLGEVYARRDQPQLALELLRKAAELLKRNNRTDEYLKVAERITSISPDDHRLLREVAAMLLGRGDTKRALAKLQLCFKADPKDVETLNLLAQAFQDLGQVSKMTSVFRELAQLHADAGRAAEARSAWRRILELAPEDTQAMRALGVGAGSDGSARDREATTRTPAPTGTPRPIALSRPVLADPAAAAPPPRPATGLEAIPRLLTETDVYLKYGLHEKALDHLDRILSLDSSHLDALEKVVKVKELRKDADGAASAAVRLIRAALERRLDDRARSALAHLRELAPAHADLPQLVRDLDRSSPTAESPASGEEVVSGDDELVLELEPITPDEDDLALSAAAAAAREEPLVDEPASALEPIDDGTLDVEATPEDVAARGEPAQEPPATERAGAGRPALETEGPPVTPVATPHESPGEGARDAGREAFAEDLAEIDFFLGQRLFEDAEELLRGLLASHPGSPELGQRLDTIQRARASAVAQPPSAPDHDASRADPHTADGEAASRPAPSGPQRIDRDLAEELERTPATPGPSGDYLYSVQDVFGQFKRGIEQTVTPQDSATHYDLGIAYKEMGLVDDALHEFEVAFSGAPAGRKADCLAMVAACEVEKGDAPAAVAACRRALALPGLSADTARAIEYQLAGCYEAAGDPESALHHLHRVLAGDPHYRDAAATVARLGGGPGRPPPGDPADPLERAGAGPEAAGRSTPSSG